MIQCDIEAVVVIGDVGHVSFADVEKLRSDLVALKKEIQEELRCNIQTVRDSLVLENISEHHGIKGHEIVFAFPIQFSDSQIYSKNRFQIFEARASSHWVEWIEIKRFNRGEHILFPPGLLESWPCEKEV